MNKFSLLFMAFIFVGAVAASDAGDVQKQEAPKVDQTQVAGEQAKAPQAPASDAAAVVQKKEQEAPVVTSASTVPAPAPVEQDKEGLSVSMVNKLKLFLSGCLFNIKQAGSIAKYYILGDVLTDFLAKKGYIATPDTGLINTYINGVTPRRLVNFLAIVALVNAAYYGYEFLSKDQDQDDFILDEEDEDLY